MAIEMRITKEHIEAYKHLALEKQPNWNHPVFVALSIQKGFSCNAYVISDDNSKKEKKAVPGRRRDMIQIVEKFNMYVEENKLMGKITDKSTGQQIALTVVPSENGYEIAQKEHQQMGHLGITKLASCMRLKYVGILFEDINQAVKDCHTCLLTKTSNKRQVHNNPIEIYMPFQRVGVDITVFNHEGHDVNLLTVIDFFSRFGWVFPMNSTTADNVSSILRRLFMHLGRIPKEFHSDNGPQFTSEILTALMKTMGVALKKSAPYTPQHGGRYERFHATIKPKISYILQQSKDLTFEEAVDSAVYLYNNTPHSSLSYKGSTLTPLQVWQPGNIDRSRSINITSNLHSLNLESMECTDPAPEFTELAWERMQSMVDNVGLSSTAAVMLAEQKITKGSTSTTTQVKIGDVGVVPLQKKLRQKGQPPNVAVRVTGVSSSNTLCLEALDKDFQETGVDITTPIHMQKFNKYTGKVVRPSSRTQESPSLNSSDTEADDYLINKNTANEELEMTGKSYHELLNAPELLINAAKPTVTERRVMEWVDQFLSLSCGRQLHILSLIFWIARYYRSPHCDHSLIANNVRADILQIISDCGDLGNIKDHGPQLLACIWPHVQCKKLRNLAKETQQHNEAVEMLPHVEKDVLNCSAATPQLTSTPVQASAENRRKMSLGKAAIFLYKGTKAMKVERCQCKGRNPCTSMKCSCYKNGRPCYDKCSCIHCQNTAELASCGLDKEESPAEQGDNLHGIVQFANNCYAGSVLCSLRAQPWWLQTACIWPEVPLVEKIESLFRVNKEYLEKSQATSGYEERRCELHTKFCELLTYMEWDGEARPGTGNANDAVEFYEVMVQKLLLDLEEVTNWCSECQHFQK